MDAASVIVTALALGAQLALKPTVEVVVKDAYSGLKALVRRKFGKHPTAAVDAIEQKPESSGCKEALRDALTAAGIDGDREVIDRAADLLRLLESHSPGITGGLVGQINAAGGKVLVLSGGNKGTINM